MKFDYTPEEEWDSPPDPGPGMVHGEGAEGEQPLPPSPAVLIAAAAERLNTRARVDVNRLHTSLNRMLYTVEAARPPTGQTFEETNPELGVDVFRPSAFGARSEVPRG